MTATDASRDQVPVVGTTGPLRWIRRNLFRNVGDSVISVVFGALSLWVLWHLARFVFVTGDWAVVRANLSLFLLGSGWEDDQLWRPAMALIVAAGLGGLVSGAVRRRQHEADLEAGRAELSAAGRAREIAVRFWPAVLGLLVLLFLAETMTPWFVVAGAVAAMVAGRLIGVQLPRQALGPLMGFVLAVSVFMVWLLTQATGWNEWGGMMLNIFLAVISIALCFPLGVVLALGRRSKLPIVRALSTLYIEVFRGVPLLVLLLMANAALGFFIPQSLAPGKVVRAIIVFTLFTAAYVAEIVRGGLQSLPPGQVEAGKAMGLSPTRITFLIVLPQALRNVIPAMVGQFISLFKDTTLAGAAMGFLDLLAGAEASTKQDEFQAQGLIYETLAFVSLLFWVGAYTMSRESQRLEAKLGVGQR